MTPRKVELGLNLGADLFGLALGIVFTYVLRGWGISEGEFLPPLNLLVLPVFIAWMGWLGLFSILGMYRRWSLVSRSFQVYALFRVFALGGLFLLSMNLGPDFLREIINKQTLALEIGWIKTLLLYLGLSLGFCAFLRMLVQWVLRLGLRKGYGLENILILGEGESALALQRLLSQTPELGYISQGFVSLKSSATSKSQALGGLAELNTLIPMYRISAILISDSTISRDDIVYLLGQVMDSRVHVLVVPDLYDVVSGHFKSSFVHNFNFKELLPHNMPVWQAYLKRLMDVQISLLLLLLTSPLLLLTALAIRLDSKGPIFYSQERIGQYGRPFLIWKFRTMRTDAEASGPQWATKKDPRITRIGQFLRKTRIDEIPQFLCVLRGDMSIVGPRPERQHFIDLLVQKIPLYSRRLVMKPGITGWAQVCHSYDTSIEDVRKKLMYDLYYFENMSLLLDLQIMLRTVMVVFTGKGAQ